jgi:FkbM family methyltransferase
MRFSTPNSLCKWRVETFSIKEPETLDWIDGMPLGSVFWDVGANVGLYSIYAYKKRKCKVYAFEPSVFNLELLARNIKFNTENKVNQGNYDEQLVVIPLPLSEKTSISELRFTSTEWGGALSTFGETYGWHVKKINEVFKCRMSGITMDEVLTSLNVPMPDYIKLDVDGIEHIILSGGNQILKNVKSILVEVNDDFVEQVSECYEILTASGLKLIEKKQSEMVADSTSGFEKTFNQIWKR